MAGIVLGIVLLFSVELCITTVYKVEPLNATDKNVFYDQESNRCHIMGIILLEKTEAETVSHILSVISYAGKGCIFQKNDSNVFTS